MTDSIRAGDFRICPSCGSRNKVAHNFCVRCSASMDAAPVGAVGPIPRPPNTRTMRVVLAGSVIAAVAFGLVVRTIFQATREVSALSEDVRADNAATTPPAPPPPVSGWVPGANVSVDPGPSYARTGTPTWSSESFPDARPNPHDVPGDPNASMVGIAPRPPRVRAALKRQRVFTENDLLATRGGAWSTPAPEIN